MEEILQENYDAFKVLAHAPLFLIHVHFFN